MKDSIQFKTKDGGFVHASLSEKATPDQKRDIIAFIKWMNKKHPAKPLSKEELRIYDERRERIQRILRGEDATEGVL